MDNFEKRTICSQPGRKALLLRLDRAKSSANETWDTVLSYCKWIFFVCALLSLALFGFVWPSERLLQASWLTVFCFGIVAALLPALARKAFGIGSFWQKFDDETLVLDADCLEFSIRGAALGSVGGRTYVWNMRYADIKRLEYDRAFKVLRVIGRFDEERCVKADIAGTPKGMRPISRPEKRPDGALYLEFPLFFAGGPELLEVLEGLCGVYVHPARRADDMADLRDLPGIRPERQVLKPMLAGLLAYCALMLITSAWQSGWLAEHPYRPFPPTELSMLGRTFSKGEKAVLDGCEITLAESGRAEGGYELSFRLENKSGEPLLFHAPLGEGGNVRAYLMSGEDIAPAPLSGFEDALVKIEPDGIYEFTALVEYDVRPASLLIAINSDLWPYDKPFWREDYVGGVVTVDEKSVKSNEVVFMIKP